MIKCGGDKMDDNKRLIKDIQNTVNDIDKSLLEHMRKYETQNRDLQEFSEKVASIANLKTNDNTDIRVVTKALLKKYMIFVSNYNIDRQLK